MGGTMMSTPGAGCLIRKRRFLSQNAFGLQDLNAAQQTLIVCQNFIGVSCSNRTNEDVHGATMDAVIPAKIEESRRLNVVGGFDLLILKWIEKAHCFGEL